MAIDMLLQSCMDVCYSSIYYEPMACIYNMLFSLSVQLKLDVCSFHLSKLVSMVIQCCCYRVKVSLYHGLVVCCSSGDQRGGF